MKKLAICITLMILTSLLQQSLLFAEDEPSIDSLSGIIIDAENGQILYQKNPHKKLNPASITKLLTALIALDTLNPQDTLTFSQESIDSLDYGSSRIGMKVGETITVEDALHGLLLMSANEVANALAEKSSGSISEFVIAMNEKAKELGALDTNFENPHGLTQAIHLTTVYDMALITREIIKNDYFLEIMKHTMYQIPVTNKTDELRDLSQQHKMVNNKNDMRIYREDVIAGKVGYTKESGHTLVTAAKQGDRTLIVVIMKTDANNVYSDTAKLLDYGFSQFTSTKIDTSKLQSVAEITENDVNLGSIELSNTKSLSLLLPEGYTQDSLEYSYTITSGLNTTNAVLGEIGGNCDILIDDAITLSLPLYIDKINRELIATDSQLTKTEATSGNSEIPKSANKKKSILPILLILLIFIGLSLICLPRKYLLNRFRSR